MSEQKPILQYIADHIVDGELPEDFSLPKDENDTDKIRFADGARDGISIYHMGQPAISTMMRVLIAKAMDAAADTEKAVQLLKALFQSISPLGAMNTIQEYVVSRRDSLSFDALHTLMLQGLFGADADMVKLGMMLSMLFKGPNENLKGIIRTLGLSDEFTLFAIFNMLTWEDSNEEIFALAQCVHGWGRIHAVERLNPETQEIRDWLLCEGIQNNIMPDYSAAEVYQKADIPALLKQEISDAQLNQIAAVLRAMFDEGPVMGISGLPEQEAAKMLGDFLRHAAAHPLTPDICGLVRRISEDKRFAVHADACAEIQSREAYKSLLKD